MTTQQTNQSDAYSIPLESINVSDPALYQNDSWRPYFARLRDEAPIHYLADSQFGPFWSITRYNDIVKVDSDYETFSAEPINVIGDFDDDLPLELFIAMDPPKHDLQRAAVQGVVAPSNLAKMESLIRSRVEEILDNLPIGSPFNLVDEVSINLTSQMLATLFDFPFEQRHKLIYWSDQAASDPEITGGDADKDERMVAMQDCLNTFGQIWQERLGDGQPPNDLIRMMQNNPNTADMIDRPMEFLGNLVLLIIGGNDTTRNSITGGVLALNQNPLEYEKLRENPKLINSMVPEIIRWQTPLMHMRRTVTKDVEFGGHQMRKGDKVVMWYISGNRDESAIESADQFIIDRKNPRNHLSFGFGVHRCMGNRLAEMQLRVVWEEIMKRFRFVEVVSEPTRAGNNLVRGYSKLDVVLHPY